MRNIKHSHKDGVTLLELLVSISAIAIVSILIAQVFFTTTKVNRKTLTSQDIKQSGDFVLETISRMVRNSRGWSYSCDVGASSTKSASFINPDLQTTTLKCISDGTVARIASVSGSGVIEYLTGSTVTLSSIGGPSCKESTLAFSCSPLTESGPLSIKFTLAAKGIGVNPANPDYQSFETSVQSRNTQ